MYRFFIESTTSEGWTSTESNVYPLEKSVCEYQLQKALRSTTRAGRKISCYWIEEVTE